MKGKIVEEIRTEETIEKMIEETIEVLVRLIAQCLIAALRK